MRARRRSISRALKASTIPIASVVPSDRGTAKLSIRNWTQSSCSLCGGGQAKALAGYARATAPVPDNTSIPAAPTTRRQDFAHDGITVPPFVRVPAALRGMVTSVDLIRINGVRQRKA